MAHSWLIQCFSVNSSKLALKKFNVSLIYLMQAKILPAMPVTVKTLPTEAEKREIRKQYDAIAIPTLYSNMVFDDPRIARGLSNLRIAVDGKDF